MLVNSQSAETAVGCAFVNGSYCSLEEARISVLEPAFTHSDVVYDVTSTWRGLFFRLDDHLDRFRASCRGFQLPLNYSDADLRLILATCVRRGGVEAASYCALVATRGVYAMEGAAKRDIFTASPGLMAYAIPYLWLCEPEQQMKGLHLIVAKTPRIPSACVDARYKNYHWGDLTQGKFEARAAGADYAVHLSIDGFLTEGAGFNVFFVSSGCLCTPAHNVLEGITRRSVMELARDFGLKIIEGDFKASVLHEAEEAFITSTAGGVMPVARIDDRVLGAGTPGRWTLELRQEYWRQRENGWLGTSVSSLLDA